MMDSQGNGNEFRMQKAAEYRAKFEPLFRYIPYFTSKEGSVVRSLYDGEGKPEYSVPVPVFDSTVLAFVKEVQSLGLTDRNYVYTIQRNRLRNAADERMFIARTTLRDIDNITAIMSKYVLGGMTKGVLWSQAVEEGIFLHCLVKVKELVSVFDGPDGSIQG